MFYIYIFSYFFVYISHTLTFKKGRRGSVAVLYPYVDTIGTIGTIRPDSVYRSKFLYDVSALAYTSLPSITVRY